MNFKQWDKNYMFVVGIDPAGIGTTGIYTKYIPSAEKIREFKIEIKSDNEIDAVAQIVETLKNIEHEVQAKFNVIAVEKVQDYAVSYNKNQMIPKEVRATDRLDAMLALVFTNRYYGILPHWKSKREYESIKKGNKFKNFKKSEHIVDAKLIYDRAKEIFRSKKSYYTYKGELKR